jgi:hypothetical protein
MSNNMIERGSSTLWQHQGSWQNIWMWGLYSCVALFMFLIVVHMHIIWQGFLRYCIASFLTVLIVHMQLCILLFLLNCVGCFMSFVISGQHITSCTYCAVIITSFTCCINCCTLIVLLSNFLISVSTFCLLVTLTSSSRTSARCSFIKWNKILQGCCEVDLPLVRMYKRPDYFGSVVSTMMGCG